MREFIYSVVIYSFICELLGAITLSLVFWSSNTDLYVWNGIFHSISSFCTAGLSTFSDGLVPFQNNPWLNIAISTLCILGSLGFIVALDFYKKWRVENHSISFTTKVILIVTFSFMILGTILFFCLETLADGMGPLQKLMIGFFQVVTAMTTCGFNTVDIGSLSAAMLILLAFLSTFGAAPSGTGGGLKNTAFASLIAFVRNTLKGKPPSIWNHEIPPKRVKIATVAFIYYVFTLSLALFILTITEHTQSFLAIFFESANAINNSGLSMGLTSNLTDFGRLFISLLMLIGRTGVLTFGVAISSHKDEKIITRQKAELVT